MKEERLAYFVEENKKMIKEKKTLKIKNKKKIKENYEE